MMPTSWRRVRGALRSWRTAAFPSGCPGRQLRNLEAIVLNRILAASGLVWGSVRAVASPRRGSRPLIAVCPSLAVLLADTRRTDLGRRGSGAWIIGRSPIGPVRAVTGFRVAQKRDSGAIATGIWAEVQRCITAVRGCSTSRRARRAGKVRTTRSGNRQTVGGVGLGRAPFGSRVGHACATDRDVIYTELSELGLRLRWMRGCKERNQIPGLDLEQGKWRH